MIHLLLDLICRYAFGRGQRRFTRFVAVASMLGMVLGVASLITVLSVMNGFSRELHERVLSVVPHGYVTASAGQLTDIAALATSVAREPEVEAVAAYIDDTVLFRVAGLTRGALLTGVDPNRQHSVSDIENHISAGDWSALADTPYAVVLGSTLARLLGVGVGDAVEVIMPALTITPMGTFPRRRMLTVVAEFSVGADPDANRAFVSLNVARKLTGRNGADGLQFHLSDILMAPAVSKHLSTQLGDAYDVVDWSQTQGSLFAAVRMEKLSVAVLLFSVIAVAAFNIVSTLTMSVTEKRHDIAVLRVLGMSAREVLILFIGYGVALATLGISVGGAIGVSLALNINFMVSLVEKTLGFQLFDPNVYYIASLPSELLWADVAWTIGAAMLLSLLATVYPSLKAARIPAAEALRHD